MTNYQDGASITVGEYDAYIVPEGRYRVDIDDPRGLTTYQLGPEFPGESRIAIFKNAPYGLGIFPTWVPAARGYTSIEEALKALPEVHEQLLGRTRTMSDLYDITVGRTIYRSFLVEADSEEEAQRLVREHVEENTLDNHNIDIPVGDSIVPTVDYAWEHSEIEHVYTAGVYAPGENLDLWARLKKED